MNATNHLTNLVTLTDAGELQVLLGNIARMASPEDAELSAAIALARKIGGELANDLR